MINPRLAFAFALLLPAAAFAKSSVKNAGSGRNVEDAAPKAEEHAADHAGEHAGDAAHAAANPSMPHGVPQNTLWVTYPSLKSLPEHTNGSSHGILRLPSPAIGWAVGFNTNTDIPKGEVRSGTCGVGPSPKAFPDSACMGHVWVSATPGGGPVAGANCYNGPIMVVGMGASLTWHVLGPGAKPLAGACLLEPGRKYYCSYTATGWDRSDEHKPKQCDIAMASPLTSAPDN